MDRVGDFIGIHADEARLHSVHELVKVVDRTVLGVREVLVHQRGGVHPEVSALQHHSLPEEALALVHSHTQGTTHRQIVPSLIAALLVQAVPYFVDSAGQAL